MISYGLRISKRGLYEPRKLGKDLLAYAGRASNKYLQAISELSVSSQDPNLREAQSKAAAQFENLHHHWRRWEDLQKSYQDLEHLMATEIDAGLKEMASSEMEELDSQFLQLEEQIKRNLLKGDNEDDGGSAILEIRAGTGGDEAALFTAELFEMYQRYAQLNGWHFDPLSVADDGSRAIREATAKIDGENAFGRLKFESGVHRVQRVPLTESQGRIHTSTATVAILPQPQNLTMAIPERDIRIDVYRSSGAGGQHANKTNSAVRVVHIPTGMMVCIQEGRCQQSNKAKALSILQARLYQQRRQALEAERRTQRQSQIGNAERSEKIRTYNFPQGRITDHRINHSLFNLESFFQGKSLDEFTDRLCLQEEAQRLEELTESL